MNLENFFEFFSLLIKLLLFKLMKFSKKFLSLKDEQN